MQYTWSIQNTLTHVHCTWLVKTNKNWVKRLCRVSKPHPFNRSSSSSHTKQAISDPKVWVLLRSLPRQFYAFLCQSQAARVITGVLRDFDGEVIDVRAKRKFGPAWEIDKNLSRGLLYFVYLDFYDAFEWTLKMEFYCWKWNQRKVKWF